MYQTFPKLLRDYEKIEVISPAVGRYLVPEVAHGIIAGIKNRTGFCLVLNLRKAVGRRILFNNDCILSRDATEVCIINC